MQGVEGKMQGRDADTVSLVGGSKGVEWRVTHEGAKDGMSYRLGAVYTGARGVFAPGSRKFFCGMV